MKKFFYIILLLLTAYCILPTVVFSQQDAEYSQYMFNRLAINPAYAGTRDVVTSTLLYRDQWTGIAGAPSTASFSIQAPIQKKNAGLGMELITDKLGLSKTTAALASYSYHVQFLKGKLAFGLRMGMYDYVFDWDKVKVKDQSDVFNTGARSSKVTGTGDFGMYYYTRSFYWGLGMTHLNKGKITDIASGDTASRQSVHFFMPAGKSFEVGNTIVNPSILVKGAGHSPLEVDLNLNVLLKQKFWIGLSLRSRYGIVFLTQYLIGDKLRVGYSYDYGLNKIGIIGRGTHEIMIAYDLNFKGAKVETLRYF